MLHPLQCQSGPAPAFAPALLLLCIAINVVSRRRVNIYSVNNWAIEMDSDGGGDGDGMVMGWVYYGPE